MGKILMYAQRLASWRYFPLMASLVLMAVFMLGFYWRDMVRGAMCTGANDEHCAREWVSALGGWIAIVFAYLTIRTMTRQTEDANRHQRENIELQILDKLAAANRVVKQAEFAASACRDTISTIDLRIKERDFKNFPLETLLRVIAKSCDEGDIRLVSLVTGAMRYDPLQCIEYAEAGLAKFNFYAVGGQPEEAIQELREIRTQVVFARDGFVTARRDGFRFIEHWKTRAGML